MTRKLKQTDIKYITNFNTKISKHLGQVSYFI